MDQRQGSTLNPEGRLEWGVSTYFTLPKANSSHLKIGRAPKGNDRLFQPSIFRCKLVVSFLGGYLSTLNNNCHSHILYYIYTHMWCFSLFNKGCSFYSWVPSSPTIYRSGYRGAGEILSIPDGFGR